MDKEDTSIGESIISVVGQDKLPLTKEFLEQKYLVEKQSCIEISRIIGCHVSYVYKLLRKAGIKTYEKRTNLIGKRFGMLTVISYAVPNEIKKSKYLCRCDCGNDKVCLGHSLITGDCVSCGCKHITRYGDIQGGFFARMKRGAKERGLNFEVTIRQIWELFLRQNKQCALTGGPITLSLNPKIPMTASLDRIDSSRGYTIDNIQWVHKYVNAMKWDFTQDEFLAWADKISLYNKEQHSQHMTFGGGI